jgi:hypothetical protein
MNHMMVRAGLVPADGARRWILPDEVYGTRLLCGYWMRSKVVCGFQTDDMVQAEMPTGSEAAIHVWSGAIGANGFRMGNADGVNTRDCKLLRRADADGHGWQLALPPRLPSRVSGAEVS